MKQIESETVAAHKGERLDVFLARELGRSRARVQALLGRGLIHKQPPTARLTPSYRLRAGDSFLVDETSEPLSSALEPEDIPLHILYEDEALLVLNKPPGLVVHPAAGNRTGTLVHALLHHYGKRLAGRGGAERMGIVHRLDKDTSGLMVIAKTDAAHDALSRQFAERQVVKVYLALARGKFRHTRGECRGNIGRHPVHRKKMAVLNKGGRAARTEFKVIKEWTLSNAKRKNGFSVTLIECLLHTGRTHQIRVHLAHLGHPVLGDPVYGRAARPGELPAKRQLLHAARLGFVHPLTAQPVQFEEPPPPDDFQEYIRALDLKL